ncbi:transposase [Streptomyces sp. NPDC005209]|uniref:transposase n=1 Tax=Streptomyces sp. NPDC005209 TaxID=3156715 RepID=UPI0033B88E9E
MADNENPAVEPVEDKLGDEVVERLMDRADSSGAALLGEGGLLTAVTRAVLERALDAEMTEYLGYERHDPAGRGSGNSRNGTSPTSTRTQSSSSPEDSASAPSTSPVLPCMQARRGASRRARPCGAGRSGREPGCGSSPDPAICRPCSSPGCR